MNVTVIGSGAIGLTIAFRLAQQGVQVTVLEQGELARKSSWAGAGILPPSNDQDPVHPLDHLQSLSNQLHPQLSKELCQLTGIDNEYRRCGGIYLARTVGEAASLQGTATLWEKQGIEFQWLDREALSTREPHFSQTGLSNTRKALFTPSESQLRNPRHLQALLVACKKLDVRLLDYIQVTKIEPGSERVRILCHETHRGDETQSGNNQLGQDDKHRRRGEKLIQLESDCLCIATGAWTSELTQGISNVQVVPIKGHMLLYKLNQPIFETIINEANRYVVSRQDGHILVGSSEEESGWDESICPDEVNRLKQFAMSVSEELNDEHLVETWTGLRPMAYDGIPYIGPHSNFANIFFATGHFRSGLHLSPATADIVCRQVLGQSLDFDVTSLRPER